MQALMKKNYNYNGGNREEEVELKHFEKFVEQGLRPKKQSESKVFRIQFLKKPTQEELIESCEKLKIWADEQIAQAQNK